MYKSNGTTFELGALVSIWKSESLGLGLACPVYYHGRKDKTLYSIISKI